MYAWWWWQALTRVGRWRPCLAPLQSCWCTACWGWHEGPHLPPLLNHSHPLCHHHIITSINNTDKLKSTAIFNETNSIQHWIKRNCKNMNITTWSRRLNTGHTFLLSMQCLEFLTNDYVQSATQILVEMSNYVWCHKLSSDEIPCVYGILAAKNIFLSSI